MYSPFYGIDKAAALQGARVFGERDVTASKVKSRPGRPRAPLRAAGGPSAQNPAQPFPSPQCLPVIVQLLYLKCQGEMFTKREATDVFFASTKLFQLANKHLRRLVYLLVKEFRRDARRIPVAQS